MEWKGSEKRREEKKGFILGVGRGEGRGHRKEKRTDDGK
jgi:hypothetical protein